MRLAIAGQFAGMPLNERKNISNKHNKLKKADQLQWYLITSINNSNSVVKVELEHANSEFQVRRHNPLGQAISLLIQFVTELGIDITNLTISLKLCCLCSP